MIQFLRKAVTSFQRRTLDIKDPAGWTGSDELPAGERTSSADVLGLSAVWACVNLLAGTISTLPLMVYRNDGNGSRKVAKDHPLYRVLHDSPNRDQTAVDFLEFVSTSIELWGNSYSRIVRNGDKVVSLVPVRPDLPVVDRNDAGRIRYRWSEDGKFYDLTDESVLHVRGFGGGPLGGLSTLAFGRQTFGLAIATDRAARQMFVNGMRPSGQIVFKEFLTDPQRQQINDRLVTKFMGAINNGRPYIAEGGAEWKSLSISPEDAQMLETRGFSIDEVCRFFGVPPFMIGHTEKSTSWGTGLSEQVLGFQKFTLRRRLKRVEQAIEKQLLTPADRSSGVTIEFNLEGLLRGDTGSRFTSYQTGLQNGIYTINEVRALENLPPIDGGDVPRMQMQNVPITEAGKPSVERPAPGAPRLRVVGDTE